jgi:hypothetical protein
MLMTFDNPDSNTSCTRRTRSNTPLQALTLWNDTVFFECAQALGRRIVEEVPGGESAADVPTVDRRIVRAFRICLAREPDEVELGVMRRFYHDQMRLAEADTEATTQLVGTAPKPPDATDAELAAAILVGRTLLNLDEFITRE